ncbi:PrgI family protein [Candidatus Peregrinibacteria bacterium]|nr:PrgI family protein [Candidatus Peregrinibacteria bacterium]
MDPIKIPQNVYVEDRIIGSLTLRQIIVIVIGGGISYIFYAFMQKTYGYVGIPLMIISAIPMMISVAFAFVRIHDLSLLKLILLLIERSSKPHIRTWGPRSGITIIIKTEQVTQEKKHAHTESAEQIQTLSTLLDTLPSRPIEGEEENLPQRPVNRASVQIEPLTHPIDQPMPPARVSVSLFQTPPPANAR